MSRVPHRRQRSHILTAPNKTTLEGEHPPRLSPPRTQVPPHYPLHNLYRMGPVYPNSMHSFIRPLARPPDKALLPTPRHPQRGFLLRKTPPRFPRRLNWSIQHPYHHRGVMPPFQRVSLDASG